jgi:glycosyltransferase involved in cell wall biosynthesis
MENHQPSILFTSFDFEQKTHRGITFYAKSVIKATKNIGYQNYLLTSARSDKADIVQKVNICRQLVSPTNSARILLILKYIKGIVSAAKCKHVTLDRSAIEGLKELTYLSNIHGFSNISSIYNLISLHSQLWDFPYQLKLHNNPKVDVVFCASPMNICVNNKTKLVQTIHDIIPLSSIFHPPEDSASIFYKRVKNMMIHSDIVLSVSDFSKQEIRRLFPEYAHKLFTSYQPVPIYPEEFKKAAEFNTQQSVLIKYQLQDLDYLLFIGTLEKRKNILQIIEAYLAIKEQINIPLVIVGALGYGKEEYMKYLKGEKNGNSIKYLRYISTVDKLVLLKKAKAFIFPSFLEGFGLPPLEAMQMGCPVLTSNVSALPEICGDAAYYVDPFNLNDIAKGMLEITTNNELREKLIAKGYQRVEQFSANVYQDKLNQILSTLHQ